MALPFHRIMRRAAGPHLLFLQNYSGAQFFQQVDMLSLGLFLGESL